MKAFLVTKKNQYSILDKLLRRIYPSREDRIMALCGMAAEAANVETFGTGDILEAITIIPHESGEGYMVNIATQYENYRVPDGE